MVVHVVQAHLFVAEQRFGIDSSCNVDSGREGGSQCRLVPEDANTSASINQFDGPEETEEVEEEEKAKKTKVEEN